HQPGRTLILFDTRDANTGFSSSRACQGLLLIEHSLENDLPALKGPPIDVACGVDVRDILRNDIHACPFRVESRSRVADTVEEIFYGGVIRLAEQGINHTAKRSRDLSSRYATEKLIEIRAFCRPARKLLPT